MAGKQLGTCLFCIVNSMVADGLATQGARASVTLVLTQLSKDILPSVSEVLLRVIEASSLHARDACVTSFILVTLGPYGPRHLEQPRNYKSHYL